MSQCIISEKQLLAIPEVVDEINKHLWCESERCQRDFGFDNAKTDWIENHESLPDCLDAVLDPCRLQ